MSGSAQLFAFRQLNGCTPSNLVRAWLIASVFLLAGCSKGIDPPAATPVVDLAAGEFSMGESEVDPCREMRVGRNGPVMPGRLRQQSARVVHEVAVDRFCLDAHEVTVDQYRHCVARGACSAPDATNAGNQGESGFVAEYYGDDTPYGQHPVMGVSWNQAQAYCAFRDGRLPSEIEWAFAARSRGQRDTIWVDEEVESVVESGCEASAFADTIALGTCTQGPQIAGRSTQDVTLDGIVHLAGNASEWVGDEFDFLAYCDPQQGSQPLAELFEVDDVLFVPRVGDTLLSDAGCLSVNPMTARYEGVAVEAFAQCKESCRVGFGNVLSASAQMDQWGRHACASRSNLSLEAVDGEGFPSCDAPECMDLMGCPQFCDCLETEEPPSDGRHCLVRCVDDFQDAARDCVQPGVAFACVPLDQNANCEPVPWCFARSSPRGLHSAPADNLSPTQRGAHVVRGGHFQSSKACDGRPAARRGEVTSSPLVGFRCAYDLGTRPCPE